MHLSGWLALGAVVESVVSEFSDPRPSFVPFTEYSGYNRFPLTIGPTMTARIERFPAPVAPIGAQITYGGLFDSEGGPRYLMTWLWCPPLIEAGPEATFPPLEVAIVWSTPTLHLLHASELPDYEDRTTIDRGREIGTWNNRPITTGCRLAAQGGTFAARAAAVRKAAAAA